MRIALGMVIILTPVILTPSQAEAPPTLLKDLEKVVYFKPKDNVKLSCRAQGSPMASYEWKKDRLVISGSSRIAVETNGDLKITSAIPSDDGYYQCFATNLYGTACSSIAHLRHVTMDPSSTILISSETVKEGDPFHIEASTLRSVPAGTRGWYIHDGSGRTGRKFGDLTLSKRIQMAENGDLYFAYVKPEDHINGMLYVSTTYNQRLNISRSENCTELIVSSAGGFTPKSAPQPTNLTQSQVVALVGSSPSLRCFFSGNPVPNIAWTNGQLSWDRMTFGDFDTRLVIRDVSLDDGGRNFTCTGSNDLGNSSQVIQLLVEEAPRFASESDHPYDATVSNGQSVTFRCDAQAKPEATIAWYRNGLEIEDPKLSSVAKPLARFEFSSDRKSLTIVNVCSNCSDRDTGSDMMVIQCNASNVHGYAFRNGFVNVNGGESNKTELNKWLVLLIVSLKSLLLVQ